MRCLSNSLSGRLKSCNAVAGFTLLEVLVAISIFAIIGLASQRVLTQVMASQSLTHKHGEALAQLQRGMSLLERDLQQLIDRPVRAAYGDRMPALVADDSDYSVELTRIGWHNPLGHKRSQLQRLAYSVGPPPEDSGYDAEQNYVLRHYWQVLDRAQDSEPRVQPLIAGVDELHFRFLDMAGDWHRSWPPQQNEVVITPQSAAVSPPLPVAIEVEMLSRQYGAIRRLIHFNAVDPEAAAVPAPQVATP